MIARAGWLVLTLLVAPSAQAAPPASLVKSTKAKAPISFTQIPSAPDPATETEHVVRPGETLGSIALSQVYSKEGVGDDVSFAAAREWGAQVLRPLIATPFAPRTLVNVNFPPLAPADVQGIRVVRQGFHDYGRGSLIESTDPRGYPYFWFGLHGIEHTAGHATDLEAIGDGFISVTPLHLDLTHDASLAELATRFPA